MARHIMSDYQAACRAPRLTAPARFNCGRDVAEDLQAHVKAATAPYKYPRRIVFVDQLPKVVGGKNQRAELRKRAIEG